MRGLLERGAGEERGRLHELLEQPPAILAPRAYDPLGARLVEVAGFPAVYMTGSARPRAWPGCRIWDCSR